MRRRLAFPLVTALSAALALPLTGTAYAAACLTYGTPPHLALRSTRLRAEGTFQCLVASEGMRVTVCIQEQRGDLTDGPWFSRGCETVLAESTTDTVSAEVQIPVMVYATYLRTVVTASNDNGDVGSFTSPPVFWFNCACSVG